MFKYSNWIGKRGRGGRWLGRGAGGGGKLEEKKNKQTKGWEPEPQA